MAPAVREPMLGYHPCSTGFLTCARDPGGGQCQAGSLTGAVASERVSEALKGSLRMDGLFRDLLAGFGDLLVDALDFVFSHSQITPYNRIPTITSIIMLNASII